MSRKRFLATLGAGAVATAAGAAGGGAAVAPAEPTPSTDLPTLLNLDDVEALAQKKLPEEVYNFLAGGAADELTVNWNRQRYREIRLHPRVLRDLEGLDCSTTVLGRKMPLPVLLAPTASQRLSHPEGELATARGAGRLGATMVLSSGSNTSIEDVIAAASAPIWFQLYVAKDRGHTRALVERVQAAGAQALCVTVDSPLDGPRNRQMRKSIPPGPGTVYPHYFGIRDASSIQTLDQVVPFNLQWRDIEWLRSASRVPLLLKGVTDPDDAARAVSMGADGIVVSNHGGRCLDTQLATIDSLPRVVEAVGGKVPVIVDGGIRRGTDIIKAIALGASAVQIGRPYVYGLAVGGADGVEHVLKILRQELLMAMSLLGRPTIGSIDRSVLWP